MATKGFKSPWSLITSHGCTVSYRIHKVVILKQYLQQVSQHTVWVCPSWESKKTHTITCKKFRKIIIPERNIQNHVMYNEKSPGKKNVSIRAIQYLDVGHQTGQDQPCGTPQSPSPQVLISCKHSKNRERWVSHQAKHLHLYHLADALVQSDLRMTNKCLIYTTKHKVKGLPQGPHLVVLRFELLTF